MAPDPLILALDQGTTNTKAVLIDRAARVVATASRPVHRRYPRPGWVQQDPDELWRSAADAAHEVTSGLASGALAGIAVTNQRESVMLWERATGKPLGPCVGWQCRRTAQACADLEARGLGPMVRERTGLPLDPLFSATKAAWLLGHEEGLSTRADRGEVCLGTVDSWLLWNLTGGAVHQIEVGNASRTQLLDIRRGAWDPELLEIFGIPPAVLPEVTPSAGMQAKSAGGPVPAGVPTVAIAADSHAALFGHGCFEPGMVKATYGTGSSLMTPAPGATGSTSGLAGTIAWQRDQIVYASEANITAAGATVDWLAGVLGTGGPDELASLAAEVAETGGVYLVPAFAGLGAPHWDERARGLFSGLDFGTGRAELARAAVESMAYQVRDVVEAFEVDGTRVVELHADGGASRNDVLMQFQADLLGRRVVRSGSADLALLGVARMAGVELGWWAAEPATFADPQARVFEPTMSTNEREQRYAGWRDAVARALAQEERTDG